MKNSKYLLSFFMFVGLFTFLYFNKKRNPSNILIVLIFVVLIFFVMSKLQMIEQFNNKNTDKCTFNITPYTSGKIKIDLADIIPRYQPGLSQHGDINDPKYLLQYQSTLKLIQNLQSLLGNLYKDKKCKDKYIQLLQYMAKNNYMIGNYSGQGVFAALIFLQQILSQYIIFQSRNPDTFTSMEPVRKYFANLTEWLANIFKDKKDNKLLLRITTEILSAIINKDKIKLNSIKQGLINHLSNNFDNGFIDTEKERGAKIAHYNSYYMIFLWTIFFLFQLSNVQFPYLNYESKIKLVYTNLTDKTTPKDPILYENKYKEYYKSKYGQTLNVDPVGYQFTHKSWFDYFYNDEKLPNIKMENLNVNPNELLVAIGIYNKL